MASTFLAVFTLELAKTAPAHLPTCPPETPETHVSTYVFLGFGIDFQWQVHFWLF